MTDIYKAAGILIQDKNLLVEWSARKGFYIAPGGKIEAGESPEQALVRELKEEFTIGVDQNDLEFFGDFTAAAAGQEDKTVHMKVYLVKSWQGTPKPDNEVEKIAWINSANENGLPIGSIFEHEVMPRLKSQGLIN